MQIAAVARVPVPVPVPTLAPGASVLAWQLAAWSLVGAFALYLWRYTPWLLRTRLDGKDG